jgi:hypothetical protein
MKSRENLPADFYLHIRDGKSQASRLLPALEKDYFNVAEMPFQTLLAMVVDYAQMVRFYNLRDKPDGTWESFFSIDETVVIATILAVDANRLMADAAYRTYKADNADKTLIQALHAVSAKEIGQTLTATYIAIDLLDKWLQLLLQSQNPIGIELRNVLRSVIIGLEKDIGIFCHYVAVYFPRYQPKDFFSGDLIALLSTKEPAKRLAETGVSPETLDVAQIRSCYYAAVRAIEMVQGSAAKLLSASLSSGDHDPAAGLLLVFLQLFQKLQHKINRFTLDYVDFYYDRVLKVRTRDWNPDHAYLIVLPSKKDSSVLIPRNTEFVAGKDQNKQDVVYASVDDVVIRDAAVRSIHTLFFKRDALNFPENSLKETIKVNEREKLLERQFATGCWINDVPVLPSAIEQQDMQAHPLFGAPRDDEAALMQHARIGFAFASKMLRLKEGLRTIKVTMKFTDAPYNTDRLTVEGWVREIASAMYPDATERAGTVTHIQEQQAFFKTFKDIFVVSLSAESGWLEIGEYLPSYSGIDERQGLNSLSVTFLLPENFPPVASYRREIHGDGYETELPVIKFILNPRNYLYAYGILSKLELAWIDIDVSVKGCRTVQLHNNIGQLSPLASFTPFGPLPEIGSYLIVGCPEAAEKPLTDFDVEIQWGGLPAGLGGFKTHYQGYEGFDNVDFQVAASVLSNGKWLPKQMKPTTIGSLFQIKFSLDGGSTVGEYNTLSCRSVISNWTASDCRKFDSDSGYSPATKAGFFKFALISPQQAFGHRDYPVVLAEALTFNAKQKHAKQLKKLPNPPYTPVIDSISVNYRASSQLIVGREDASCASIVQQKMIYLHPLGWEDITPGKERINSLLPQYPYSGNLFIGLKGLSKGGVITLYFYLRENSLPIEHASLNAIQWHYLSHNRWIPLKAQSILSDSTHRFMKSGIVTLDIPADMTQDNTVLPKGFFWLQLSSEYDAEKFCNLYTIYAQAIEVRRLSKNILTYDTMSVPAGTIARTRKSIPGIGGIRQIQQSFGGGLAEQRDHLRIRTGERLRHKNRALLPADYELLLLEQFPQIFKVKCFSGMDPEFVAKRRFSPGHLLIVAIPHLAQDEIHTKKSFLNGRFVAEMKNFVQKHAPSFATIHVMNPVYEVIQVRCTVKLKNALFSGMHLNRLNRDISDFLSPWNEAVGYARHFGWLISKHDIESFIQSLDYIDRVTNLSLLRIAPMGEGFFDLHDSADKLNGGSEFKDIAPLYPWSIAAPIQQHFIEIDDRYDLIEPEITGIGELEIGSTFIISDEKWREKIEKH